MSLIVIGRVLENFTFFGEILKKKKLREWRDEWHRRKCFTLQDILALDPENTEALRQIAQMDRFELRYKRLTVNNSKVCHIQTEADDNLLKLVFFFLPSRILSLKFYFSQFSSQT